MQNHVVKTYLLLLQYEFNENTQSKQMVMIVRKMSHDSSLQQPAAVAAEQKPGVKRGDVIQYGEIYRGVLEETPSLSQV